MSLSQQTIALAALFQSAALVQNIARTGVANEQQLTTMLQSILNTKPENTLAVYGGDADNIALGLQQLVEQLGKSSKTKDPELTRYIVALLAIERRLAKKPAIIDEIAKRIAQVQRQLAHFTLTDETILASLASIYVDLISPLTSKIQVAGEPENLKITINQHKIRALLFAGVRAAVLWRQVGGKRRNIIFARSKLVDCAQQLLNSV